jgi:hypothetical protein
VADGKAGSRGGGGARAGQEHSAGIPAPASATYETVNLFGRKTGHRIVVAQGEILPVLPRGFSWAIVEE